MGIDIRNVKDMTGLISYFADKLQWKIDPDDFDDIEDVAYDFDAEDIGLKEEAFAKINSLMQLPPLVDGQKWGIFCVEFDSRRFEVTALRKILSGLIPKRRNSIDHAVWEQKDLLFLCFWGKDNDRTIGVAHFEEKESGLPTIKMISCAPAVEDFTQIRIFENRLRSLQWPTQYIDHEKWHDDWSSAFTTGYRQTIQDASTLTTQLAIEAQGIRNRILEILNIETANGYVHLLYEKFRNTLIHDMTEKQFADMYAQTVVYGLFSARCMDDTQEDFSATEAIDCIPNTNPFLKSLMQECLGAQNNSKLSFDELEIGNVVDLLLHTKTDSIIQDFNRQTGGGKEDPVIHFYEEFLTAYDKQQKVQRGVYYTPQPVVNFIVRAVDSIIKTEFGLEDGLASTATKKIKVVRQSKKKINGFYRNVETEIEVPAIQVLDPATGTGTFIRQTILQIYDDFKKKNSGLSKEQLHGAWNDYVPKYLLPRINAFEIMMAPYAVAHMKLAMVLKDTGYDFKSSERLNVFLTNSLEEPGDSDNQITLWSDPLAMESVAANAVKKNIGINICIGNPPYSAESINKNPWIDNLMDDFKKEADNKTKLQEKNSKPLNDDYVKFIRYSKSILDNNLFGITAFINPHGFIDGPIFRGMRSSLIKSYDQIYVIDLHGNANRQEVAPDGRRDENVFDIKQGVCILILIKTNHSSGKTGHVYHTDIYGTREDKYRYLSSCSWKELSFDEIYPTAPECLFRGVNTDIQAEYKNGFAINNLFVTGANGIKTARDKLNLSPEKKELIDRLEVFRNMDVEVAREHFHLGPDVRDWKIKDAQNDINRNAVKNGKICSEKLIEIVYRVFDNRWMLYTGQSRGIVCYPRTEVTDHFVKGLNIGLSTGRSNKTQSCDHFLVVNKMVEMKTSERSTCACVFPLYCFINHFGKIEKKSNFNLSVINEFNNRSGLLFSFDSGVGEKENCYSELDLFYYIYAILYSNSYRKKYFDFLKTDFPRIPFVEKDKIDIFWKLVYIGERLVKLHLFCEDALSLENNIFFDNGRTVIKVSFKNGRVYINKQSFFRDVSYEDWTFMIGGYAPLQYWFRDRKGDTLSDEEIHHYCEMINVVKRTQILMKEIEEIVYFE